jgi:hypothetical protein
MRALFLCLAIVLLVFSGCTREEGSDDGADAGPSSRGAETLDSSDGAAAEEGAGSDDGPDVREGDDEAADGPPAGSGSEDGGEKRRRTPGRPTAPERQVPRSRAATRALPEDVEIGALEDELDGPVEVLAVIEELFGALSRGDTPREIIAEAAREVLSDRLDYMTDRAEISARVRVGELVRIAEGSYRASVVAYGPGEERTTGEIYVAKSDGTWYISDVLVDFTAIDGDGEKPIFEPGSGGPTLL